MDALAARVGQLLQLGVIVRVSERPELLDRSNVYQDRIREGIQLAFAITKQFRDLEVERRETLQADGHADRIPIYGVVPASPSPPLALGAIYAAAKAATDTRLDAFDLHPRWVTNDADMADQPLGPVIYMFSDYIWSHPHRRPWLSYLAAIVPDTLSPPPSWRFVIDELREFLLDEIGLADDKMLDTALRVQHAMLPDPSRSFPQHIELAHDFAAWQRQVHHARETGNRGDWETVVPSLADFEPIVMTINDPRMVCTSNTGHGSVLDSYNDWELDAPVSRAVAAHYTI